MQFSHNHPAPGLDLVSVCQACQLQLIAIANRHLIHLQMASWMSARRRTFSAAVVTKRWYKAEARRPTAAPRGAQR